MADLITLGLLNKNLNISHITFEKFQKCQKPKFLKYYEFLTIIKPKIQIVIQNGYDFFKYKIDLVWNDQRKFINGKIKF